MSILPFNFLGIPEEASRYETSPVVIVPIPLEKTTSYLKGTAQGPRAIIQASHQVEFFDAELQRESWKPGIHTLSLMNFDAMNSEEALKQIEKVFGKCLDDKKFPIGIGGEHALSGGTIAAAAKRYPGLSVLQIDAHADLRESYEGSPYSHACAMRLVSRKIRKIVSVGIRSLDSSEWEFAKQHPDIKILFDQERRLDPHWIDHALEGLSETVFLTIDVDGFDPSLIPATGTPEPGGLSWYEGLDLIRACFQRKKVVAADVVELLPMPHQEASEFITAKLVYKLVGYSQNG